MHRHELSGALHGLFRVRCFTQDDAHIFMTWDQMEQEIQNVVRLFDEVYSTFGLSYQIEVSTMPEDHIGEKETWDMATDTLKRAIEHRRRRVLRPEAGLPPFRFAWTHMAVRHDTAGYADA